MNNVFVEEVIEEDLSYKLNSFSKSPGEGAPQELSSLPNSWQLKNLTGFLEGLPIWKIPLPRG